MPKCCVQSSVTCGIAMPSATGCSEPTRARRALEALKALKRRGDSVALLLVDQRMPQMTGVEFLGQAMEIFPSAKRVLLTAYADTDAAIHAINDARIHHYLLKPWDPPEEHLYPVLDDLLGGLAGVFSASF